MDEQLVIAFQEVFSLTFKIFPFAFGIIPIFTLVRFIKDVCSDRRAYNRSWHVTRQTVEKSKEIPHVPTDCEKWVQEFEEREGISIYG